MRVGIIGSGNIAKIECPLILRQSGSKIVGIADKNIELAKELAKEFNIDHTYQDGETMVREQKPDIVHVLVPPQYHSEISIMAMNQGCDVLVEKPMALNVADAESMIDASERNGVSLCVNHNAIVDDIFERAMKLAAMGVIGDVVSVEAIEVIDINRHPALTQEGAENSHWAYQMKGGPLQDMLPHPFSLLLMLIPKIDQIQCMGMNRGVLPNAWHDEIRILVKSDKIFGYISFSLSERPDIATLTIKGTNGVIHADTYNFVLTVRKQSGLPRKFARGLDGFKLGYRYLKDSVGNIFKTAFGRIDKTYGIETVISRFYQSIRQGNPPPISSETSLRVVDLMNRVWPNPAIQND